MTVLRSGAGVEFECGGAVEVSATARLNGGSRIYCHTYADSAPILSVVDEHVRMSVSVPDPDQVTADDVTGAVFWPRPWASTWPSCNAVSVSPMRTVPGGRRDVRIDGGGAAGAGTSGRPWVLSRMHERGDQTMRRVVTGEELAQIYNPDPFALPRWRAPVYRTPFGIILAAKLFKLLAWIVRMAARHPLAATVLAAAIVTWVKLGWVTLVALVLAAVVILSGWRWFWPVSFSRWVGRPARGASRAWRYRRRWAAVMTIAGVAPWYQGRTILPVLGKVTATPYVDRVQVRLVSGQSVADFADHAENLAHGFRALLCRVRTAKSGAVVLEFIRRDALAALVPALPIPDHPDLKPCRSAAARTACPGWSSCTAPMC
jgi:hypothetical protein